MRVLIDVEANGLEKPTKIWCIVCKDIDTGTLNIFRNVVDNEQQKEAFRTYAAGVSLWVGHNVLGYDYCVIDRLLDIRINPCLDTLIISKLINYSRPAGHSLESYGVEFNYAKGENSTPDFFKEWSLELEDYCVRDVEICGKIYDKYRSVVDDPSWRSSLDLEHAFQHICNSLTDNGFYFNSNKASKLLDQVTGELASLDTEILNAFPPREVLIREFIPKETKFGTISKTSIPRSLWASIHEYEVGKTYRHTRLDAFNPASHKQIIQILNEAGWRPEEKTQAHIEVERELHRARYDRKENRALDIKLLSDRLIILKKSGWKVNEHNLSTLPPSAPLPARTIAKRILLEARRRTLVEWLALVQDDNRVHGKFYGIGAWTHRMAHQAPNTANIPRDLKEDGSVKLLGKELRELWSAPRNRLLVGVDAEGIQLRIFAHYINDPEFIDALVKGKKDDKSDPHSLNQRVLGPVCKTRQAAKRFIYALLLGAGMDKLAAILGCTKDEAKESLDRLLQRYTGFADLKRTLIPQDAKRGYFIGLDGRRVPIPGATQRDREHLCMSGYLQNGESIVVKRAACRIDHMLADEKKLRKWLFVDIVHDEFVSETKNDMEVALKVAQIKADAIRIAGEELGLICPLAGSYWNEDTKDYTIGTNWFQVH